MKKLLKICCLSAWPFMLKAQNTLFNNGSILKINAGAIVQVNGSMTNESGSSLQPDGELTVTGNVTNNQFMNGLILGVMRLNGTTVQTVDGTEALRVNDLEINNNAGITLNNRILITGECRFIDGIVTASNYVNALQFSGVATVSITNPPSNSSHVNGYVHKFGTGYFEFPVGDGIQYQKVGLNLSANTSAMVVKYENGNAGVGTFTSTGTEATPLVAYNNLEYWDIFPLGSATGTVSLFWDAYNNTGISDVSHLKVAHKSGGDWLNEGTVGIGSVLAGSVTSNPLSTWSPFALGSTSMASPLPINLLSFTGRGQKQYNYLQWITSSEKNNSHFILQRSSNAVQFEDLATINSKGTQGNSDIELNYDFTDHSPYSGVNYYRLQQIDFDGNSTYSAIVKLWNQTSENGLLVYPNPVLNSLTVQSALNGELVLLNDIGQTLLVQSMEKSGDVFRTVIDFSNLSGGIYYLKSGNELVKVVK